ncbi:MAG TPA: type II toxin-antitoxin system prevent-host-death family antitoxin [Nitrospirota bacterium]|nr:type II toxin-antitoxin system prevent-host-death family antitoxin [Nitrospirota bacterium]
MITASFSELKALLSKYLSKVKAGEEVVVTKRGNPIAKLIPIKKAEMEIPPHLLTLERAGLARIDQASLPESFWSLSRPKDRKGIVLKAQLKEREKVR